MKLKKGQQFKIDSIEELKEAYERLSPWRNSLNKEIIDFRRGCKWLTFGLNERYSMAYNQKEYETTPNPFKKEKPEPFSTLINNMIKAAESAETFIKVVEMIKERNELRK